MTMLKPGRRRRLAALLLALLSSAAAQPASASNQAGQSVAFTLKCLGLAFSDPEQHVEVCNPVFHPPSIHVDADQVETPPPPPPPPPPSDDDEGCPDGMFESDCGGCYYPA